MRKLRVMLFAALLGGIAGCHHRGSHVSGAEVKPPGDVPLAGASGSQGDSASADVENGINTTPTGGALAGRITDRTTGEMLHGVTVTVTSPKLSGAQTATTDEQGWYKIPGLPEGEYLITFYYEGLTVERRGVLVFNNKTTPVFPKLDVSRSGEVIKFMDSAPTIDPTSTTHRPRDARTSASPARRARW